MQNGLFDRPVGHNSMRIGILNFSGIKPVKISSFAPIKSSTEKKRKNWLEGVEKLGSREGK